MTCLIKGGGRGCQNAQGQIVIKAHLSLTVYKPEAYYPFTMACIQYVAMIHLIEWVRVAELLTEQV